MKTETNRKINDHTFVVCAYGECKYLEECIDSLFHQNVQSQIIMVTSTPNELIHTVSERYKVPLYINNGAKGITQDWNFALSKVGTKFCTIAHQDDTYEPEYTQYLYEQMKSHKQPIIGFTDYYELRKEEKTTDSQLIKVKKALLFPLRLKIFQKSRFIRRRSLSLGCPICCPSVMYCLDNIELPLFNNKYICCEDWETWEELSRQKGSFVYIPKPLMAHRIHQDATTTKTVNSTGRSSEDYEMFRKFWPAWIARILEKRYSKAEELNK